MNNKPEELKDARNEDPITGEPGSHPVGVGVGTTAGAATGAAIGAIGGPLGVAVGAIVGGVAGAVAGKAGGEALNPTVEDAYWREHHSQQGYATAADDYESDYAPAYRLGWEGPNRYGTDFDSAEESLRADWEKLKDKSKLDWQVAKNAIRSGWHRVERKLPGDADKDGI